MFNFKHILQPFSESTNIINESRSLTASNEFQIVHRELVENGNKKYTGY